VTGYDEALLGMQSLDMPLQQSMYGDSTCCMQYVPWQSLGQAVAGPKETLRIGRR
jgi:hypothetical protein